MAIRVRYVKDKGSLLVVHHTSNLFALDYRELAFLQKVSRGEYQFITEEEQASRQLLRDKLNEVVLNPKENLISVRFSTDELRFLAVIVRENSAFVNPKEGEARNALRERLAKAAGEIDA